MKKTKGYMAGGKARMSTKMMANGGLTGALKKDMSMSKGMANTFIPSVSTLAKGGKTKGMANGGKTVARGSGAARTQYFGKNG
tara:strand:- start:285 stop:533 length:249 start_codon:yes stop_codon:yes gene_type:complete